MKITDILREDGRIVKGVNTTVDVDVNQIPKEASKFGNKVDKDGRPPTLSTKVKGKSTNVLFNLGLSESVNRNLFNEALGEIANATEIYVDMDGVLADFFTEWAKIMGVKHWSDIPNQYNIEDALEKIRDTKDFWLDLPLTPNAKNLLSIIKEVKGRYKILSSPLANDPRCEDHKREWVNNNLRFFPPEEVIISHNKAQYAKQADGTPNILIDDYGVNIRAWEAAGGYGFKHKDHKFERTASAIKQHMQEPAEESVQEGITLQFQRGDDFDTLHIKPKGKNRVELRGKPGYESGGYDAQDKLHQVLDKLGKAANFAELMNGEVVTINPKHPDGDRAKKTAQDILSTENFADGKKKGKSRPGRVKKAGASCKGSVTSLRKKAAKYSGERGKMYHWCANMKGGKKK